jgi:hypothetical protein
MGLDQFAYTIDKDQNKNELAFWRKHPNLQGWMEKLWNKKGRPGSEEAVNTMGLSDFNCIPLQLTKEDIIRLEYDITYEEMPITQGFFFGSDSDKHYREQDLKFCKDANEALDKGLAVYYDSWW